MQDADRLETAVRQYATINLHASFMQLDYALGINPLISEKAKQDRPRSVSSPEQLHSIAVVEWALIAPVRPSSKERQSERPFANPRRSDPP
jgi:hypothetical protein